MRSTPLICSSIGATTVDATTSAFAPGYWPDKLMTAARSRDIARPQAREGDRPRITMTIETTEAKIGRSMKNAKSAMSVCAY